MITSTNYATLTDGTVSSKVYDFEEARHADGDSTVVAVKFSEGPEYLHYDFEGPPAIVRSFETVSTSYVGRVLETYSREERIMSDVWDYVSYATVATKDGDFIEVGATNAVVDAPPALVAKWEEFKAIKKVAAETAATLAKITEKIAAKKREAATPYRGKKVKVVKGRKVPKGTTGEVIWYGAGKKYSYYGSAPMRVGVKDATGTVHWTNATNVEVVAAAA